MALALVVLIGVLLCPLLARRSDASTRESERLAQLDRLLASRATPFLLGAINALLVWWWVGWQRSPAPMIHDEAAYLLQSALFARGRWTGEALPLPEFFAQLYVFTDPVLASKYPPGWSLLLAPFVAVGFPALGPMSFAAFTGGLIFVLARRVANGPVALLTWLLWSSGSALLRYQASFLSQTATTTLWLASLYFTLEYRTQRRPRTLIALGVCIGAMGITRPVTALALAIPIGVVVLRDVWHHRTFRVLVPAALAATAVVALLPLQNHMTTGNWRLSPLVAYSTRYTPFDFPGFGYDASAKVAPLPADLDSVRTFLTEARRRHRASALPATLASRAWQVMVDIFAGWRMPFMAFALIGVFTMPTPGLVAFAMSLGLLVTYAFHAHWPQWTAYYVEGYPAVLFASAVGLWAFTEWVVQRRSMLARMQLPFPADVRVRSALIALCAFVLIPTAIALPKYRAAWQRTTIYQRQFTTALRVIEDESPQSIVFVDYGRNHDVHSSLVWNVPNLAEAKTWIAHERGPDDLRLMRLAPHRRSYVYRADKGQLMRLPPLADLEKIIATHAP